MTNEPIQMKTPPVPGKGFAVAAILQAIPGVLWWAVTILLCSFIAMAVWFNVHNMQSFTGGVIWWVGAVIIVSGVVVGVRLLYVGARAAHDTYHDVVIKRNERKTSALTVSRQEYLTERARLQNEQLLAKIDLELQLPHVIQYALANGHNIEYGKGGLRVQNYLSNLHAINGQLPPAQTNISASIPTFRELMQAGTVQNAIKEGEMLLGFAGEELRRGGWLDLYSCGIGGVSGSGKSTTVRFILFQAIMLLGKLVMVDPHLDEPDESLAAQFVMFKNIHALPPCDDKPAEVAKRTKFMMREFHSRKKNGVKGPPLVFVLDEFNALVRRLPEEERKALADLMLTIAQEGRKFGLYAMVIAQRWSETDLGGRPYGAAIRGSLASTLAHRFQDEEQAKKLAGSKDGPRCLRLPQGHYLFSDTQGRLSEMVTPLTTAEDGIEIQRLLDEKTVESTLASAENTVKTPLRMLPSRPASPLSLDDYRAETTKDPSIHEPENTGLRAMAKQVMQLQAQGLDKAKIMRQVWNVNPGGTEEYKKAVAQYQLVMEFIAEQLAI